MNYWKLIAPSLLSATLLVACTDPNDVNDPKDKPHVNMKKPDAGMQPDSTPDFKCPQDCAPAPSAAISCDDDDQCVYTCDAGRSDLNDDLGQQGGDGCESQCVPSNGGIELCDGEDNDCDGAIDEDFTDLGNACLANVMACSFDGKLACASDKMSLTCVTELQPSAELCDGIDNDCDGTIDNGFEDKGTECTQGQGVCTSKALWACSEDKTALECPAIPNTNVPDYEAQEMVCDDLDNDCDGEVDEGCDDDGDEVCDKAMTVVGSPMVCPKGKDDCNDTDADIYPGAPGKCDGKDNDCNGEVDDLGADLSVTPPTFKIQSAANNYANFAQVTSTNPVEYKTPSVMVAAGKTGFCFVGVDRRNRRIHTQWLRPDGTSTRDYTSFPTIAGVTFNIMDVKVGVGAEEPCAFILSESGNRGSSGDDLKYKGRLHVGLWSGKSGEEPKLKEIFKHEANGVGPNNNHWLEEFAMYAAMTSYTKTIGNVQREVFGIFYNDPNVVGTQLSQSNILWFIEFDSLTQAATYPRLLSGGGGLKDVSRHTTGLQVAAYAKNAAEQFVYFYDFDGVSPNMTRLEAWKILPYDALTLSESPKIPVVGLVKTRASASTNVLFPFSPSAHGYIIEPNLMFATSAIEPSVALATLSSGMKKTPVYRTRNMWAPPLPGTEEQWMMDPLGDGVVTIKPDPGVFGRAERKEMPHGNTTFNQLLAIGQIDGKVYVADMTNFGAASGTVDPQLKLYPYTCH